MRSALLFTTNVLAGAVLYVGFAVALGLVFWIFGASWFGVAAFGAIIVGSLVHALRHPRPHDTLG